MTNYSTLKPVSGASLPVISNDEIAEPLVTPVDFSRAVVMYCRDHGPYAVGIFDHIDGTLCPRCENTNRIDLIKKRRQAA